MSKQKKIKAKTTGFDIMYRVVTAILAVAMFPAVYFCDLIYYEIDHSTISSILKLFGSEALEGNTYGEIKLSALGSGSDTLQSLLGDSFSLSAITENPIYRPVIAAAVLLALALVLALVIIGFAAFSNKVKVIAALSGAGTLLMAGSFISFTSFFAKPIISGEIALAELFGTEDSVASLLLSAIGKVAALHLDDAFFAVLFLMIAILIWSVAVIIVNAGEDDNKKPKKVRVKKEKKTA